MLHFRNFFVTREKNQPSLIYAMTWVKNTYFEGLCEDNFTTSITIYTMDTLNALLFIAYISKT